MSRRPRGAARRARVVAERRDRRLIRDFLPPEGVPLRFEVAPLGARLGAQVLDLVATAIFAVALVMLLAATDTVPPAAAELIGWLLFLFVRAPYYVSSELLWNGQTLGKRARGLRVVSADGRSLRPYAIAVRNVMKELEVFVPGTALFMAPSLSPAENVLLLAWIGVLLAVPLLNHRRQRLGDMIAGTYVIRQPQAVLMPDVAVRAAGEADPRARFTFLAHQLDHYGAFELQTLEQVLHGRSRRRDRAAERRHRRTLVEIADRIRAKIAYTDHIDERDVPDFLEAFYIAQRRHLETRKLFGEARADKHHANARRRYPATESGRR